MFFALASLVSLTVLQAPPKGEPVFDLCKKLVGNWEGVLGNKMKLKFSFKLEHGGELVIGDGVVGEGTPHPMVTHATLGWDPVAKKVYYLDQHGTDTIYFGHVTREGNDLVFDFSALSGDTGHYKSRSHVEPDRYVDSMQAEKAGKWVDMGFHLELHRKA